jgi:iron complex outermembrane receptor protein
VYGQGTYKLNDNGLAFTLGARYTAETVGAIFLNSDDDTITTPPAPGTNNDPSRTYDRLSWQIGLQDQIDPNLLVYAVSRRAFKSGGYNGQVGPQTGSAAVGGNEYGAEDLTDVEIGAKFQGQLAAMPVRMNIALFNDWDADSQRTAYAFVPPPGPGPTALTVNVPDAITNGVEAEGQVKPVPWLTLGASFSYVNAQFTNGNVVVFGTPQVYNQVPGTPKISGVFYSDVQIPVTDDISVLLHGDVYGQTKVYNSPVSVNNYGTVIPGYPLFNFRVGLENSRQGWSLIANIKNAFNKVYYTGGVNAGEIFQINTLVPADPRTFTVEARISF